MDKYLLCRAMTSEEGVRRKERTPGKI